MVRIYTKEEILETIAWSAQLEKRDKEFSVFFLDSEFLDPAYKIPLSFLHKHSS